LVTSVVTPAYGGTGSGSGTVGGSFSGLGIIVNCGGTYYAAKWDQNDVSGPPSSSNCGSGAHPGNCDWPPDGFSGTITDGCPSGVTATVTGGGNSILISAPSTCTVERYVFKCGGDSGSGCPGESSPANTTAGNYTIPSSC
jgi:hypothetical protein